LDREFTIFSITEIDIRVEVSLEYTHNLGKVSGLTQWDHLLSVSVGWLTF